MFTPSAERQITELAQKEASKGIRIGVKIKGCSGRAYTMELANSKQPFEEEVEFSSASVFIDPKAVMFLIGTTVDYVDNGIESGFVFQNPNEKGRCGCGKSFYT